MTLKDWIIAICAVLVLVSAVLKIFFGCAAAEMVFYASVTLVFFIIAFEKIKK